ncbi:MAG: hypothetical protein J6Q68_01930 [Clostridia bacterium]|nr:hypothetical protein [Clostridia bacterium]
MNGCGDDGLASVSCEPCCVAFSNDGSRLAIGARDNLDYIYMNTNLTKGAGAMNFGNTIIFGDSYSTFKDAVPNGYAVYYTTERELGPNITDISQTWWFPLLEKTNANLIVNDSWSGSTIGYTGYGGADTSKTSSFIKRLHNYIENGLFEREKIDTVLIFGATNDSWSDAPVGENKYENITNEDLYYVLPAVCYFLSKVKQALPSANIYLIINTELKEEISSSMAEAAKHYGITSIALSDIEKDCGHPTVRGMNQITEQILNAIS